MIIVTSSFSKNFVFKLPLGPHENEKPLFSCFSGFKSVFEKPFLLDGALLDYLSKSKIT